MARMEHLIQEALPKLPGWCTPYKGKQMGHLVARIGADHAPLCVELGVFGGRSLIAMALAVKHCLKGRGTVDGIDPFTADAALEGTVGEEHQEWWSKLDYSEILHAARRGIETLGLDEIVQLKLARSEDVVGDYASESIDILHQDSNHSEEVSCGEVAKWASKMRAGGYWVFDDTQWESTQLAQNFLLSLGFTRIAQHDSWAVFQAPPNCGALRPVMPAFTPAPPPPPPKIPSEAETAPELPDVSDDDKTPAPTSA